MDIGALLETTGLAVAEGSFLKAPALPYILYTDNVVAGYENLTRKKKTHNLTVTLYSAAPDETSEGLIEALFTNLEQRFARERSWIAENAHVAVYTAAIKELE